MNKLLVLAAALALVACQRGYPTVPGDLDDGSRPLASRLVSAEVASPTPEQLAAPVVVATHGFSATTFEISVASQRLRDAGVPVSEVLLGGHGTSITDFEKTTWRDWQAPVVAEYAALVAQGYTNINVLGTSTGGTLWLEAISRHALTPPPKRVALVAPLIDFAPNTRLVGYTGAFGWFGLLAPPVDRKGESLGRWYRNRPLSTLASLIELTEIMKTRLTAGVPLPSDMQVLVIQGDRDPTVDPRSAEAIRAGLRGHVTVDAVSSPLHVPIWPDGVDDRPFTPEEQALRTRLVDSLHDHLVP